MTVQAEAEQDYAARLMTLFEGYAGAYGTYNADVASAKDLGGKVEIKSTAVTRRETVTRKLWASHVEGVNPLGITPLRDDNTCLWGVLDVDVYDLNYADFIAQLQKENLPLVPCRSKSGGIHAFLFSSDPVRAVVMQARLREMAALLGYGTSEVFPKQTEVMWEKGDLAGWLNMPYFGGEETDRYGIKPSGLGMTIEEFLQAAEKATVTAEFLTDTSYRKTKKKADKDAPGGVGGDPDFGDGPPCMQHMSVQGFPEGTRNVSLFNLGTFAKKKYGGRWKDVLEDWSRWLMEPPLAASEVMGVIKQLEKKDVHYQCKIHPLSTHCNGSLCRTRRFGVGGEDDFPHISGLSVLKTTPPLWFVDVGDRRIELTTEQLQGYAMFHRACMEQLFVCYKTMKSDTWFSVLAAAMRDVVEIEVPSESGIHGQFMELLEDFLLNKHRGETPDDILLGRPWEGPNKENGEMYHWFRLRDLRKALDMQNFRAYTDGQILARLRILDAKKRQFNLQNNAKSANTWGVRSALFEEMREMALPHVEESPL